MKRRNNIVISPYHFLKPGTSTNYYLIRIQAYSLKVILWSMWLRPAHVHIWIYCLSKALYDFETSMRKHLKSFWDLTKEISIKSCFPFYTNVMFSWQCFLFFLFRTFLLWDPFAVRKTIQDKSSLELSITFSSIPFNLS